MVMGYSMWDACVSSTRKALAAALGLHWSGITVIRDCDMAMSGLHYGYVAGAALAAASARREAVLRLPCQAGENKNMCSSYGSLSLLPGS